MTKTNPTMGQRLHVVLPDQTNNEKSRGLRRGIFAFGIAAV
jgi:hypothetical protein